MNLKIILIIVLFSHYFFQLEARNFEDVRLLPNPDHSISFVQASSGAFQTQFKPFPPDTSFEWNDAWLKIQVDSSSIGELAFVFGSNELVEFYASGRMLITGDLIPMSQRNVAYGKNIIRYLPTKGRVDILFIRLSNQPDKPINPYVEITTYTQWELNTSKDDAAQNLTQGIFQGILWIIAIFMFFFFITSLDYTYLYYSLCLLFAASYSLVIHDYLWGILGEYPFLHNGLGVILLSGSYFFYFEFLRHFLQLKEKIPLWNTIFTGVSFQFIIMGLLNLAMPNHSFFNVIRLSLLIFIMIVTIVFFIVLIFRKNYLARFIVGGTFCFFASILFFKMQPILGISQVNQNLIVPSGIILEILIFSLGLSYRIRLVQNEKRKIQASYVSQLEVNEKIQIELNEQLENKVELRTKELTIANKEIKNVIRNLEDIVEERTKRVKIQNTKLMDYAFKNAHNVRAPLSNILGLASLLKSKFKDNKELANYVEMVDLSAQDLDEIVREMNQTLKDEGLLDG